jgi:1,4-alpha-glucan branching enzyme
MHMLEEAFHWLPAPQAFISCKHDGDKTIIFDRANLVFVFNFHPTRSYEGYRIGVPEAGDYKIVLDSDRGEFGGHDILCKVCWNRVACTNADYLGRPEAGA